MTRRTSIFLSVLPARRQLIKNTPHSMPETINSRFSSRKIAHVNTAANSSR
jgi:hypothetical protein